MNTIQQSPRLISIYISKNFLNVHLIPHPPLAAQNRVGERPSPLLPRRAPVSFC